MLYSVLLNIGLSEKEAVIYLALLELGTTTAYTLSKKTSIHHSTVYVILDNLIKKGLVSKYDQTNTTKFNAENPDTLFRILEHYKKEINEKEDLLKKNFSELSSIFKSSRTRPTVKLYEGKQGIQSIERDADQIDSFLNSTIHAFTPMDLQWSLDSSGQIPSRRIARGQSLKLIYTHKDGIQNLTDKNKLREARFLPRDKFPFDASVVISPNHNVRIYTYKKNFSGIWIDNPDIANSFKTIFDICWMFAQEEN